MLSQEHARSRDVAAARSRLAITGWMHWIAPASRLPASALPTPLIWRQLLHLWHRPLAPWGQLP